MTTQTQHNLYDNMHPRAAAQDAVHGLLTASNCGEYAPLTAIEDMVNARGQARNAMLRALTAPLLPGARESILVLDKRIATAKTAGAYRAACLALANELQRVFRDIREDAYRDRPWTEDSRLSFVAP